MLEFIRLRVFNTSIPCQNAMLFFRIKKRIVEQPPHHERAVQTCRANVLQRVFKK